MSGFALGSLNMALEACIGICRHISAFVCRQNNQKKTYNQPGKFTLMPPQVGATTFGTCVAKLTSYDAETGQLKTNTGLVVTCTFVMYM